MPHVVQVRMGHTLDGQHETTTPYAKPQELEWRDAALRHCQRKMLAGHCRHATTASGIIIDRNQTHVHLGVIEMSPLAPILQD
jgi:hypothetical protein